MRPRQRRVSRYLLIASVGVLILAVASVLLFGTDNGRDDLRPPENERLAAPAKPSALPTSALSPKSRPLQPTAPRRAEMVSIGAGTSMIPEEPANRLAFDPDLRSSILERIRTQKEREYAGLHRPWLDAQPLSEDDRSTLTTRLVDYDVWVASQLMPGETITTPSETEIEFEFIAEERSRLIANIAEEFGEDIAESYVQAFPGPEPGQFVRLSDDMSPMPPIPTDFVPENAEPPTDQLPANR